MRTTVTEILNSKSRVWNDDAKTWINFSDIAQQAADTYSKSQQVVSVAQTPFQAFFDYIGALANNIPFYQWMRSGECLLEQDLTGFSHIAYTSGTTGYPQRIMHKFDTFVEGASSMVENIFGNDGPIYCISPWQTNNIASIFWLPALMSDRDLVIKKFNPYEWADDIEQFEIGWTIVIPAMHRILKNMKSVQSAKKFSTLKRIGSGANIIDPGTFDFWREKDITPYTMFGSTEVPACVAFGPEENWLDHKPIGADWFVDGNNILHLKWSSLNEFWCSNDIVEQNDRGGFRIVGRATTQFKYKDILISPEQQESLARTVNGVENLGLTVVDNHLVMFYEGQPNLEKQIHDAIAPYVTSTMVPKVHQVSKIPVNLLGKISRAELKELKIA
jgi:acyl-coenzyme A synthetase/AMP-(fatty) acid ligase